MACAIDVSSPIRFSAQSTPPFSDPTASFTAPANSLLVMCANLNDDGGDAITSDVWDTGPLTWTLGPKRGNKETVNGGESSIWWAKQLVSAARTVSLEWTNAATSPPRRLSGKVYVITGVDLDNPVDAITADNEGESTTNEIETTFITPTADGILIVNSSEWQAAGVFDASDDLTQESATWPAEFSVCSGWKPCFQGVAVRGNLNGGGAGGVQHKWTQIIVRAAFAPDQSGRMAMTQRMG